MSLSYDVIVVGDYCFDIIFTGLGKFPELGKEVVAGGFGMVPGGSYNTAAALHRLGVKVGWAGDFGNDELSAKALEWAEKEGLDRRLFVYHARSLRRVTVAASFRHDRAFIAFYDPDPNIPAGLKALPKVKARCLYIPGLYYGAALDAGLAILRAKRMKLVMDGNSNREATLANPAVRRAIGQCEIFMPNAGEARRISGEDELRKAASKLAELAHMVVVKDGANGAYAIAEGQMIHAPALEVTPVDTTGAGDCFNAGFLAAWLRGCPLEVCLKWGNIVGGLSTLGFGGTGRVVTVEEVEAYLRG
ncbi:MAG: carbohydrate kinase family protein [Chloroflexota bacterium]